MSNTLELLQIEFCGPTAPLKAVASKYLGIHSRKAADMAKAGTLPVPAMKLGSAKSPWVVHLADLAELIDRKAGEARKERQPC